MNSRVLGVDFVEFWCGNAKITADYWCKTMGFQYVAARGFKSGSRKRSSHVVSQGNTLFVFTSATTPADTQFYTHQSIHGDAVRDIAFSVDDVQETFNRAISNGATPLEHPYTLEDEYGSVTLAQIGSPFGDVIHTLINRTKYCGKFLPGFLEQKLGSRGCGVVNIDHVAMAYEKGKAKLALEWYRTCLGFEQFFCNDEDTREGMTILGMDAVEGGLKTIVAACNSDKYCLKLVLVEAIEGSSQNQLQEFLEFNGGHGVQHIALQTNDIFATVDSMQRQGLQFLKVPSTYYDNLFSPPNWFMSEKREDMERLGLLLDVSEAKRNLNTEDPHFFVQCFTLPIEDRPTFFLEIISRKGSSGFGQRTIKALFEAVEEQRRLRDSVKELQL
jgi:4-hydroxyphenylpyruvate dioxygenase